MKKIKLTCGYKAIVDNEDYDELSQYNWFADKTKYGIRARRNGLKKLNEKSMILMTRQIMNPSDDMVVDHKNHNTLDNRKENLRVCTKAQNNMNSRKNKSSGAQRSKYKGVSYHAPYGRSGKKPWRMFIRINGKQFFKYFETENAAVGEYNRLAKLHFREFAYVNR